jgi:hypothetical protein
MTFGHKKIIIRRKKIIEKNFHQKIIHLFFLFSQKKLFVIITIGRLYVSIYEGR